MVNNKIEYIEFEELDFETKSKKVNSVNDNTELIISRYILKKFFLKTILITFIFTLFYNYFLNNYINPMKLIDIISMSSISILLYFVKYEGDFIGK